MTVGPPSGSPREGNASRRRWRTAVHRTRPDPDPRSSGGGRTLLARAYWMLFGYVPLFGAGASMIESEARSIEANAAYWAAALAIVAVRYVDITRLGGRTAENEPASLAHWRRHAVIVLGSAAVAWIALRAIPAWG